jgi:hypothetical protein
VCMMQAPLAVVFVMANPPNGTELYLQCNVISHKLECLLTQ